MHSLEHGAVWIAYEPGLPRAQVETLRELARETYVLVAPYRGFVIASSPPPGAGSFAW